MIIVLKLKPTYTPTHTHLENRILFILIFNISRSKGEKGIYNMPYKFVTYFLLLLVSTCIAQENAQPRVAPGIVECYRRADLFERDNRLPMTPSMLIELIRKVEDAPGSNQGIRQIATGLLHRFRQDGIIPAPGLTLNINQNDILRFSTNGFNFPKHRVLLSRLIQGNANQFPISNLTIQEQVKK